MSDVLPQGDHLPECKPGVRLMGFDPDGDETCLTCRALRACEDRVREKEFTEGAIAGVTEMAAIRPLAEDWREAVGKAHDTGYAAGLDAATEAVADRLVASDWDHGSNGDGIHLALAAIAALKAES